MSTNSILADFLKSLGVPHTENFSNSQFEAMPFKSLFGLSKVLSTYGVPSEAYKIDDKQEINALDTPFLADTPGGFVIVTAIHRGQTDYISQGQKQSIPTDKFLQAWNGIVMLAFPDANSKEPDYDRHHFLQLIDDSKAWILKGGLLLLLVYLILSDGIERNIWDILLVIFNIAGLALSYMLVQKTVKIKNRAADAICKVLQEGGCDKVMELKAASFFGIFSWSEVGLAYFSVSTLALLLFPQWTMYLAACNICCLPFTCWSIWYQKFKAKIWCTLCVSVQATLWLLFFCYLLGGHVAQIFPIRIEFFVLVLTYAVALMAINKAAPHIK